jgi:hypothetical protein
MNFYRLARDGGATTTWIDLSSVTRVDYNASHKAVLILYSPAGQTEVTDSCDIKQIADLLGITIP